MSSKTYFNSNCKERRVDLCWPQFVKILVGVSLSETLLQLHKFSLHFALVCLFVTNRRAFNSILNEISRTHRKRFQIKIVSQILLCLWESFLFVYHANPSIPVLHFISFSPWPNNFLIWEVLRFDFEANNFTWVTIANGSHRSKLKFVLCKNNSNLHIISQLWSNVAMVWCVFWWWSSRMSLVWNYMASLPLNSASSPARVNVQQKKCFTDLFTSSAARRFIVKKQKVKNFTTLPLWCGAMNSVMHFICSSRVPLLSRVFLLKRVYLLWCKERKLALCVECCEALGKKNNSGKLL